MLTDLQEAIISAIHQEPHYCFTGNERKAAERMRTKGLLRLRKDKAWYADTYTNSHPPKGLRYKITAKGERAYKCPLSNFQKRMSDTRGLAIVG